MTNKARTLLSVAVIAGACTIATAASGEAVAAGMNGKPSLVQYAAIAADLCSGVPAKERAMGRLVSREDIVSVASLDEFRFAGKVKYSQTEGVLIKLSAPTHSSRHQEL